LNKYFLTEVYIAETTVQTVEDIKIRLEQVKVVAVTCLGISSPLLADKRFDVCIMDEAGQTTLPVCFFHKFYEAYVILNTLMRRW
jgi:superfamily I DNA and/or RNA helicase